MTQDEIIEMARQVEFEAGFKWCVNFIELEAFAKLVREEALAQPAPVRDTEAHYKAVVEGVQKLFNDKRTQPAPVQKRPQNCGTGYCSCIECVMEPAPVATHYVDGGHLVYPTAQRTWVGLTRKEVYDLYDSDYAVFHQRIEAKLKEKNFD